MRVLVTGANGFIGRHVVAHIVEVTDWDVIALDVRHNSDGEGSAGPRVTRVYADLTKPLVLPDPQIEVNAVVNLASLVDHVGSLDRPAESVRDNLEIALTMLEWARYRSLTHFIQVSSNEVYGPSYRSKAFSEWSSIIPPTPYSAGKAAQESAAIAWWHTYNVPTVVLTAMHVFGERQSKVQFIPTTIARLLAGQSVPVLASPLPSGRWVPSRRNWLYARDLADAIVWTLARPVSRRSDGFERPDRWNVAGPSVNCVSVVERIARLLGVQPQVEYVDVRTSRPGHELVYELDGTGIRIAGWQPPFGFSSGIERTVTLWRNV